MLKVAITCNTKGTEPAANPEDEAEFDSPETVQAIADALAQAGHQVEIEEADDELLQRLLNNRPDIVFNIAEGRNGRGREAQVPAMLSYLGIPYTGSDEVTLAAVMDKHNTNRLLETYDVYTPVSELIKAGVYPEYIEMLWEIPYPFVVKPNSEGSSKGINDSSVVRSWKELVAALERGQAGEARDMLVEEYIEGREITVGILGNGLQRSIFRPMEVIFNDPSQPIYSYEVKQDFRRYVSYACPADIDESVENKLIEYTKNACDALNIRDMARLDFRLDSDNQVYFIEINPLPGLAPGYSDFPMIAEYHGMDYTALIQAVLDSALARYGIKP